MIATKTRTACLAAALGLAAFAAFGQNADQRGLPVMAEGKPSADPTLAAAGRLTSPELAAAIDAFKKTPTSPLAVYATWGEYVTPEGRTFVPLSLYLPKSEGLAAGRALTLFGVVLDASGTTIASFEEPATLAASIGDFHVDKPLIGLPAGKHRVIAGLADGVKPMAIAATDLDLAGTLDKDVPAASALILSNNVYPLAAPQALTDPYSFGGVKVVPKGDRVFRMTDELWYFVELRNLGLNELQQPRVQVKMDIEGIAAADGKKVRMTAPPREVDVPEMKGVPRHYGLGSSIPLASFQPGSYTFTVKVTDTVRKSSYTLKEEFRIIP